MNSIKIKISFLCVSDVIYIYLVFKSILYFFFIDLFKKKTKKQDLKNSFLFKCNTDSIENVDENNDRNKLLFNLFPFRTHLI